MTDVFEALKEIDPDAHMALSFIAHECIGQRQREGWTREHDDEHDKGEMAMAAACYAHHAAGQLHTEHRERRGLKRPLPSTDAPEWPWGWRWWKPKNAWRDLTRAGALIVSEMGRRIRARISSVSIDHEIALAARGNDFQKAQSEVPK